VGGCVSVVNDANCDGAADSRDALLVLEYIIGLVTTLPNTC
jgi:hypothetical protein